MHSTSPDNTTDVRYGEVSPAVHQLLMPRAHPRSR